MTFRSNGRKIKKLSQNNKDRISEETNIAAPNPKHQFQIHVDSSGTGTRSIPVEVLPSGKRIVLFGSRFFTKDEPKRSNLHRELCGTISALQTYEHFFIGSPPPIIIFGDHKPLLCLWAQKGRSTDLFLRYQVNIAQLTNL